MSTMDQQLAALIRSGDDAAFERLFREYYASLTNLAHTYTHDVSAAEDIVSTVFQRLWENRAKWDPSRGIAVYLYSAVRNQALTSLRDAKRYSSNIARAEANDYEAERLDIPSISPARLWNAINSLPEPARLALTMRWEHNMPFSEIADILGTTESGARVWLSRAIQRLRRDLSEELS